MGLYSSKLFAYGMVSLKIKFLCLHLDVYFLSVSVEKLIKEVSKAFDGPIYMEI